MVSSSAGDLALAAWLNGLPKKGVCTAGETTQWLRAFAALAENLDSVPSTYCRQLPTTPTKGSYSVSNCSVQYTQTPTYT